MARRSKEVSIFNLSFLDVLANGLGAVVTLMLLQYHMRAEVDRKLRQVPLVLEKIDLEKQKAFLSLQEERKLNEVLKSFEGNASLNQEKIASLLERLNELRKLRFMGVQSKRRNIVFLVDLSGSMLDHREVLEKASTHLIELLRFKDGVEHRFNILTFRTFGDTPRIVRWETGADWVDATDRNKAEAIKWLKEEIPKADGATPTVEAFKQAAVIPGVETIWLLSDGQPTDAGLPDPLPGRPEEYSLLIERVRSKIHSHTKGIEIRCIGIGEAVYTRPAFRDLLKLLVFPGGEGGYVGL